MDNKQKQYVLIALIIGIVCYLLYASDVFFMSSTERILSDKISTLDVQN